LSGVVEAGVVMSESQRVRELLSLSLSLLCHIKYVLGLYIITLYQVYKQIL